MFVTEFFDGEFSRSPVMAILRGYGPDKTVQLATRAWEMGITCVEVPLQCELDVASLEATVAAARGRSVTVGAGTILTIQGVQKAQAAGASFIVSPGFDADVISASMEAGLPPLPGVATATDIQKATRAGLSWVKMFPASVLGPHWINSLRGPFPNIKIVATGGMAAHNSQQFLDLGADVVAIGSAFGDINELPWIAALHRPSSRTL